MDERTTTRRFPPAEQRAHEKVWAVHPLGDTVRLRNATFAAAAQFSQHLVSRGIRNIWVYPEDQVLALLHRNADFFE